MKGRCPRPSRHGPIHGEGVARPPVCNMSRADENGRPSHEAIPNLIFDAPDGRPRAGRRGNGMNEAIKSGIERLQRAVAAKHREAGTVQERFARPSARGRRGRESQSHAVFLCRFGGQRVVPVLQRKRCRTVRLSRWFIFFAIAGMRRPARFVSRVGGAATATGGR